VNPALKRIAAEITDWQAHRVGGFLSTAAKKHSLKIESTKNEAGECIYSAKKQAFRIEATESRRPARAGDFLAVLPFSPRLR